MSAPDLGTGKRRIGADAPLVVDLGSHAAQEAVRTIVRVCHTAPTGLEVSVLGVAFALLEARAQAMRKAGLVAIPAHLVADLGAKQGDTLAAMLAEAIVGRR